MTGIASAQTHQVLSGLLVSLENGLALQETHPALTSFLLEGQIVSEGLLEHAERVELEGVGEAGLSLQLLHKGRIWFRGGDSQTLLGCGPVDVLAHGLLTAMEGGDGETRGNVLDRPVKQVMKMAEVSWTLYATMDLPRTLFFRSPDAWKHPEDLAYWRAITVPDGHASEWRRRLGSLLIDPPDYLALALSRLKEASAEVRSRLVAGVQRTADLYAVLCRGGLEIFRKLEAPDSSWDFDAQFLTAENL